MEHARYSFTEIDSRQSFADLGHSLGSKTVNNTIHLSPEKGCGVIRKIDFEKGLHVRTWNFNLARPFCLQRIPDNAENGHAFSIVYILSPGTVVLQSSTLPSEREMQDPLNILALTNNIDVKFSIQSARDVKAIDITLSGDWMKHQFCDTDVSFHSFVDKMKENLNPSIYIDMGHPAEYRTAIDLHMHALAADKGSLYLKAKTLSLISDFFCRSFSKGQPNSQEGNVLHQEKMLMVEKILEQHLEMDLPSIENIARKASLSESTLKRHFKLMFGKSIYEYYLQKKMDHAKRLLLEKPITVKEVAYRLGYEKTSNFIHIFKKFHTHSPGHIKKNIAF